MIKTSHLILTPKSIYVVYIGYGNTTQIAVSQVPVLNIKPGNRVRVGFFKKLYLSNAIISIDKIVTCVGTS